MVWPIKGSLETTIRCFMPGNDVSRAPSICSQLYWSHCVRYLDIGQRSARLPTIQFLNAQIGEENPCVILAYILSHPAGKGRRDACYD
jgi:hypothetical protein